MSMPDGTTTKLGDLFMTDGQPGMMPWTLIGYKGAIAFLAALDEHGETQHMGSARVIRGNSDQEWTLDGLRHLPA